MVVLVVALLLLVPSSDSLVVIAAAESCYHTSLSGVYRKDLAGVCQRELW